MYFYYRKFKKNLKVTQMSTKNDDVAAQYLVQCPQLIFILTDQKQ